MPSEGGPELTRSSTTTRMQEEGTTSMRQRNPYARLGTHTPGWGLDSNEKKTSVSFLSLTFLVLGIELRISTCKASTLPLSYFPSLALALYKPSDLWHLLKSPEQTKREGASTVACSSDPRAGLLRSLFRVWGDGPFGKEPFG